VGAEVRARLKWKPPSENSIDFKLVLRFPATSSREPDLEQKPIFVLHVWTGGEGLAAKYEPWDILHVEDAEWEKCDLFYLVRAHPLMPRI
jgi:mRNA guanylyltransferase